MRNLVALALYAGLAGPGCQSSNDTQAVVVPAQPEARPAVWWAAHTLRPPWIDGRIDPVWAEATPLAVVVREAMGETAPRTVVLRALYDDERIYVLAQWPDKTRSDMRDPYIWNAETKSYDRPSEPDDQFSLQFALSGDFQISMLTTKEFVADVWHWKAGRGNAHGWVDDKRHIISQAPGSKMRAYDLGTHETIYIGRPLDAGTSSHVLKKTPTKHVGDRVDSFSTQQPSGSRADVRGKGVHDGSGWTLEMTRKLNTGHDDDAVIHPGRDNLCAIAVLDDELYWRHSVSGRLLLRLAQR